MSNAERVPKPTYPNVYITKNRSLMQRRANKDQGYGYVAFFQAFCDVSQASEKPVSVIGTPQNRAVARPSISLSQALLAMLMSGGGITNHHVRFHIWTWDVYQTGRSPVGRQTPTYTWLLDLVALISLFRIPLQARKSC